MQVVTSRFTETSRRGGRLQTTIVATPPGGTAVEIEPTACQVTKQSGPGVRWEANITATYSQDAYEVLRTPGTLVAVEHGYRYGRRDSELIPMGVYEVAKRPNRTWGGEIGVDLQDRWGRLEECRFLLPETVNAGTNRRTATINMVFGAIPDAVIVDGTNAGGTVTTATAFDRDRAQAIADLARDGELECGFTATGAFEAVALPVIGGSVATFTDRDGADMAWLSDEALYERLYNAVQVSSAPPDGGDPLFSPQTMRIGNPDHPRHPSNIGLRPYFYSSPTISQPVDARRVAAEMLWRVTQEPTRVAVSTWGYPHLEVGDTVTIVAPDRSDGLFLVEKVTHDCMTNATSFVARSMSDIPLQEEAV